MSLCCLKIVKTRGVLREAQCPVLSHGSRIWVWRDWIYLRSAERNKSEVVGNEQSCLKALLDNRSRLPLQDRLLISGL